MLEEVRRGGVGGVSGRDGEREVGARDRGRTKITLRCQCATEDWAEGKIKIDFPKVNP